MVDLYRPISEGLLTEEPTRFSDMYGAGATGLLFAPGAGVTDLMGYAPDPMQPGEYLPSFGENIREGNYLDAALQTLGGAGDVMMAGGAVFPPLAAAGAAMKAPRAIRAYHGSPYDFDRFDIGEIGAGMGAQMYGRGLYFAENPDVARSFRDNLTEVPFEYQIDGKPVSEMYNDALKNDDYELAEVLEQVQLHDTPTDLKERFTTGAGYSQKTEDYVKGLDYDNIKGFDPDGNEISLGRQYEVEIAADPDMMLDYDALMGEQSEYVKSQLGFFDSKYPEASSGVNVDSFDDLGKMTGAEYLRALGPEEAAARFLRGGSGRSYKTLSGDFVTTPVYIPGLKYRPEMDEAANDRNYVIFDDETINILRKYGLLAPLVGGGTAAAVMGADEPQPAGGIL